MRISQKSRKTEKQAVTPRERHGLEAAWRQPGSSLEAAVTETDGVLGRDPPMVHLPRKQAARLRRSELVPVRDQ